MTKMSLLGFILLICSPAFSEQASVRAGGLEFNYNPNEWANMPNLHRKEMGKPNIFLQNKIKPEQRRIISTSLSAKKPPKNICNTQVKAFKKLKKTIHFTKAPAKWDCFAQIGDNEFLAGRSVLQGNFKKRQLWAFVTVFISGTSEKATAFDWINSARTMK